MFTKVMVLFKVSLSEANSKLSMQKSCSYPYPKLTKGGVYRIARRA